MKKPFSRENISRALLVALVVSTAAFARFAFLDTQGFNEPDEYSMWSTYDNNFRAHFIPKVQVGSVAWNIFHRPVTYIITWSLLGIFATSYFALLFFNAAAGLLLVLAVYFIGERYFLRNSGLIAAAILGTMFWAVFFARNMKQVSLALLFCSAGLWVLFKLTEKTNGKLMFFFGLMFGAALVTHPNTLILAATAFVLAVFSIGVHVIRRNLKPLEALGQLLLAACGLMLPMLAGEIFFIILRDYLKWDIPKFGCFEAFYRAMAHPEQFVDIGPIVRPGLKFYLDAFATNGKFLLWLCIASSAVVLAFIKRSGWRGIYLPALFWAPILAYSFQKMSIHLIVERNILSIIVPASLICGLALAELAAQVKRKFALLRQKALWLATGRILRRSKGAMAGQDGVLGFAGFRKDSTCVANTTPAEQVAPRLAAGCFTFADNLLLPVIVIGLMIYGMTMILPGLKDYSAARQIYDYTNGRAAIDRPNVTVYHWDSYYFADGRLLCDTWSDVFRDYLSRRAEYFVRLGYSVSKELLDKKYKPTRMFDQLNSSRSVSTFGVFDLRAEQKIFEELFGFKKIANILAPQSMILPRISSMAVQRGADAAPKIELPVAADANLLIVDGKLLLDDPSDKLLVSIGDANDPLKYWAEIISHKKRFKTSIHTAAVLGTPRPKKVLLRLFLVNSGENLKPVKLEDFSVGLYSLPEQYMPLATECPVVSDRAVALTPTPTSRVMPSVLILP